MKNDNPYSKLERGQYKSIFRYVDYHYFRRIINEQHEPLLFGCVQYPEGYKETTNQYNNLGATNGTIPKSYYITKMFFVIEPSYIGQHLNLKRRIKDGNKNKSVQTQELQTQVDSKSTESNQMPEMPVLSVEKGAV